MTEIEMLKAEFNRVPLSNRTVGVWNLIREKAKKRFLNRTINKMDASGFIKRWLKGE